MSPLTRIAFQSTRPLRGATGYRGLARYFTKISIHAPLTGRDLRFCAAEKRKIHDFNPRAPYGARRTGIHRVKLTATFQSTRPLRGATLDNWYFGKPVNISIHAPLTGRDFTFCTNFSLSIISIHAPLTGRDHRKSASKKRRHTYFNPRAPYGARRQIAVADDVVHVFQSTRPLRGATFPLALLAKHEGISIHAPLTGRDLMCRRSWKRQRDFNPRAPYGARQQKCTNNLLHFCYNRQFKQKIHLYSIVCQNAIP